jgi:hypothetical protein
MSQPSDDIKALHEEVSQLKETVADLRRQPDRKRWHRRQKPSVRRESPVRLFGLPLYSIAMGPDPASGELIGRATGIVAIGDHATGFIAMGGVAYGVHPVGGAVFRM